MKRGIFAVLLATSLLPPIAAAQTAQPGAPARPDVVLLPRDVAIAAMNWIAQPDPTSAVRLFALLSACMQDNPASGVTARAGGPDQCPAVAAAIEARDKELAAARPQPAPEPIIGPKSAEAAH